MKKIVAILMAAMLCLSLIGAVAEAPAPDAAGVAGFQETPIGETEAEWLQIAAVYFQPVEMQPAEAAGLSIDEADIHLEADIHALEDKCGFGAGDWIPYMTVDYSAAAEDGTVVAEGSFMPMSASDGPHYGANIDMPDDPAVYTLTLTIHSPAENQYLLHVDEETGVINPETGELDQWWAEPIVVEFEWEYAPIEA